MRIRRPLCMAGAVYVAALIAAMLCKVRGAPVFETLDRERVTVAGFVDGKEYRLSQGREITVITLADAAVLKESQITVLKQFLSDSEKISQYRLHGLWNRNKEKWKKEDAGGIEGVLCYVEDKELPPMGSFVLMEGRFYAFTHATNPGQFDGADYYRIMRQQGRLMQAQCLAVSGSFSAFREKLYELRTWLSLLIHASYPQEEASVMGAMLLGEKGSLDTEMKSLYQQNGIIHILAISGLHLSILGMGFYRMLKRLRVPTLVDIILSIALMYCYGVMTGMGVSVIRALIMFGLKLGAPLLGRTYDMLTAMMTAALLILVQQPLYLTHSGFLFSFGAICGIGLLPVVSEHLPSENRVLKALFTGMWVSLSTLPVYLSFYYEFPPYSIFLNLLVIPCMGAVLVSGVAAMAAAAFLLPLGRFIALPGIWILAFYESCCNFCMKLPARQWIAGRPENWQMTVFLGILATTVFFARKMKRRQFFVAVILAVGILTVRFPNELTITFLDVGQGDCICLEEGKRSFLIDGGSSDTKDVDVYRIVPFLKYRGISRLDAVFVTHPDSDHENGIRGMLENYDKNGIRIGMLIMPDVGEESKNEKYFSLVALAQKRGVPVKLIHAGERLESGALSLECLHPQSGYSNADTNEYSTVLRLRYGQFSALFTGDLEGEGEELVTKRMGTAQERITLLKVAHHGSGNSTSEEFLSAIKPGIAVICAGRDNSYGHPHEETLNRLAGQGCRILQTPESGAVTVSVKGDRIRAETFLP